MGAFQCANVIFSNKDYKMFQKSIFEGIEDDLEEILERHPLWAKRRIKLYEKDIDESISPLHIASKNGSAKICQILLNNGADVNDEDGHGRPPLYYAVYNKHVDVVKVLIEENASLTLYNPIYTVSMNGEATILRILLKSGHPFDIEEVVYLASIKGHCSILKALKEYVDNNNTIHSNEEESSSGEEKEGKKEEEKEVSKIEVKIEVKEKKKKKKEEKGEVERKTMIFTEVPVNFDEKKGISKNPLFFAAKNNFYDVCEFLLKELGADPNFKRVLHEVAINGNCQLMELLVNHGADVYFNSPLVLAIKGGHVDMVKILIKSIEGDNVNIGNPLFLCAICFINGKPPKEEEEKKKKRRKAKGKFSKRLMERLEENIEENEGMDSVLEQNYYRSFLRLLKHKEINPNIPSKRKDTQGNCAIHLLATGKKDLCVKMMRALLERKDLTHTVDINKKNKEGNTALHISMLSPFARSSHNVEMLIVYGAEINIQNKEKKPPLFYAFNDYKRLIFQKREELINRHHRKEKEKKEKKENEEIETDSENESSGEEDDPYVTKKKNDKLDPFEDEDEKAWLNEGYYHEEKGCNGKELSMKNWFFLKKKMDRLRKQKDSNIGFFKRRAAKKLNQEFHSPRTNKTVPKSVFSPKKIIDVDKLNSKINKSQKVKVRYSEENIDTDSESSSEEDEDEEDFMVTPSPIRGTNKKLSVDTNLDPEKEDNMFYYTKEGINSPISSPKRSSGKLEDV